MSGYVLYWYFQQNQCLNMLYTTYIDKHGALMLTGVPGQLPSVSIRKDGTECSIFIKCSTFELIIVVL